jgi:hypothetical protein
VQRYESRWLLNIAAANRNLINGESVQNGFAEFDIKERGKIRHIKSVHISERVIQKNLCDMVLVPILSRSLIYDNGASIKNKGVHFALNRLKAHLSRFYRKNKCNNGYALQIDFTKFFDSIPHDILLNKIKRDIKDKHLFSYIKQFINAFGAGVSLGLGSPISQICAVYFPSIIDHYIKEKLQIKYYARYMDDMYLIHESKPYLKECLNIIELRCNSIGLTVNKKKTRITSLRHGFIFLKGNYSLTESGRISCRPCNGSIKRMARKLKKFKTILDVGGRINYRDISDSYQSWRNTFAKRFNAYYKVQKMDDLYNRLFFR